MIGIDIEACEYVSALGTLVSGLGNLLNLRNLAAVGIACSASGMVYCSLGIPFLA